MIKNILLAVTLSAFAAMVMAGYLAYCGFVVEAFEKNVVIDIAQKWILLIVLLGAPVIGTISAMVLYWYADDELRPPMERWLRGRIAKRNTPVDSPR